MNWLPLCIILITEAALSLSHMVWSNPWWREPFLGSDRLHILFALQHWPIVLWVLWKWKPLTEWTEYAWIPATKQWVRTWDFTSGIKYWLLAAVLSQAIWWINKWICGKLHWSSWWLTFWR